MKKFTIRHKIIFLIHCKLCGGKEGEVLKPAARIMNFILFPLTSLYARQARCRYDPLTDTYIIKGHKYSGQFFDMMHSEAHLGSILRIKEVHPWGVIMEKMSFEQIEKEYRIKKELKRILEER